MKKLITILALMALATSANGQLIITGLVDGPLTGGLPKVIELYACDDIADLSIYGLGAANNGGGTDGVEYTFPADPIAGGTTFYLAQGEAEFMAYFGFAADYIEPGSSSSATGINGDDAVELFLLIGADPVVVDLFGEIDVDGTGDPWEHLDGWAKRQTSTGPDGSTFVLGNWTFSGPNALDGCTDNASCGSQFPLGGFACNPAVDEDTESFGTIKALFR